MNSVKFNRIVMLFDVCNLLFECLFSFSFNWIMNFSFSGPFFHPISDTLLFLNSLKMNNWNYTWLNKNIIPLTCCSFGFKGNICFLNMLSSNVTHCHCTIASECILSEKVNDSIKAIPNTMCMFLNLNRINSIELSSLIQKWLHLKSIKSK